MRTLVTGFEPFGGLRANSSELVVTALAASGEPGVITAVLPTSYRRAEERIGDLLHARMSLLAARHRLPAVYPIRLFVANGGLISYGPDEIDQHRLAS